MYMNNMIVQASGLNEVVEIIKLIQANNTLKLIVPDEIVYDGDHEKNIYIFMDYNYILNQLEYSLKEQITDVDRIHRTIFSRDDIETMLLPHNSESINDGNSNSDNLTCTIGITNTVLTVTDLNNFSQKYGIDICTNKDGWLVVDGTNEATLSTDELTRYIETIESMSEIMKKFVRQ